MLRFAQNDNQRHFFNKLLVIFISISNGQIYSRIFAQGANPHGSCGLWYRFVESPAGPSVPWFSREQR